MKASGSLSFLGKTFYLEFRAFDTPTVRARGISSRIPGTCEFCLFMDFDNVRDSELKKNLPYLQQLFELGDFHTLATDENSRHVICVDRLPMREVLQILEESDCDYNFKRGIRLNEYRAWILRVSEKGDRSRPRYVYTIYLPYNGKNLQSEAHALFLWGYYKVPMRIKKPDGNFELDFQEYLTATRTRINTKLAELAKSADWLKLKGVNSDAKT